MSGAFAEPLRLVQLHNRPPASENFGDWAPSVNISAALPNSAGAPLDWWARGSTAGAITNGIRKANSPNLFTVSVLNPTDGAPADSGHLATGAGTVSWTDGPSGAGSSDGRHQIDGPNGNGGFRISVPALQWPDWYLLKVWEYDFPARRISYKASLNNPSGTVEEDWIDYVNPGPGAGAPGGEMDRQWDQSNLLTTEVKFAADGPSQTLTYDTTGRFTYYHSIFAAALYLAKPNSFPARGAARVRMSRQF